MPLVYLELNNIRVYERTQLLPDPYLNLIVGENASGKTTLLEAIHLLGTGRSFRTAQIDNLQRHSTTGLSVIGRIETDGKEALRLGLVHRADDGRRAAINGINQAQVSGLAQHLPLQVISSETHYDFLNNPKHRRGTIDWGLFHVEQDFQGLWSRYQRILSQRNAALKDRTYTKTQVAWDEDLIETGERLHAERACLIRKLLPYYQSYCLDLLGSDFLVNLTLEPGWNEMIGFRESLRKDRIRDSARGFTHSGPQRADLKISLNSQASRASASHGQNKILVIALRLAQIRHLIESSGRGCCLLIDDLAAELDSKHRERLIKILSNLSVQVFVTTTELSLVDCEFWSSHKTFHVEHGTVLERD
jgi:DNA replication and repair protein RecF